MDLLQSRIYARSYQCGERFGCHQIAKKAKVHELLIDLPSANKFDATMMTSVILACISSCGINPKKMLSQCCDGASIRQENAVGFSKRYKKN